MNALKDRPKQSEFLQYYWPIAWCFDLFSFTQVYKLNFEVQFNNLYLSFLSINVCQMKLILFEDTHIFKCFKMYHNKTRSPACLNSCRTMAYFCNFLQPWGVWCTLCLTLIHTVCVNQSDEGSLDMDSGLLLISKKLPLE